MNKALLLLIPLLAACQTVPPPGPVEKQQLILKVPEDLLKAPEPLKTIQ